MSLLLSLATACAPAVEDSGAEIESLDVDIDEKGIAIGGVSDRNGQCAPRELNVVGKALPPYAGGTVEGWRSERAIVDTCVKAGAIVGWLLENHECGYRYTIRPGVKPEVRQLLRELGAECEAERRENFEDLD